MAQFTATLSDPNASYQSFSPSREGGESELASVISGGLQVFDILQRRKAAEEKYQGELEEKQAAILKQQEQNSFIVDSANARLALQDEAINAQIDQDELTQRQTQALADGKIDENEKALWEESEESRRRLSLLDPKKRALRENAEYRRLLADPRAVGMQTELAASWGKLRTDTTELLKTEEDPPAVKRYLQETYGPLHHYTAEQKTHAYASTFMMERVAKEASINMKSTVANAHITALNQAQGAAAELLRLYNSKGSISPEDMMKFKGQIDSKGLAVMEQLYSIGNIHMQRGFDVSGEMTAGAEAVKGAFASISNMFDVQGGAFDAVQVKAQLEHFVAVTDLFNKTSDPESAALVTALVGEGKDIKPIRDLYNANDKILEEAYETAGLPKSTAVEIRKKLGKAIVWMTNPRGGQDAVNAGLISPKELAVVSGNYTMPNSKTPVETVNAVKALTNAVEDKTIKGLLETFLAPKNYRATREQAGDREVQQSLQAANLKIVDQLSTMIPPNLQLGINPVGEVFIKNQSELSTRGMGAGKDVVQLLNLYNQFTDGYGSVLGGRRTMAEDLIKQFEPSKEDQQTQQQE